MIFVKSEKAANRVLISITKYIEKKLGLKVNAEKSKVSKPTGIKFLGYGFWVAKGGKYKPKPHLKSIQNDDGIYYTRLLYQGLTRAREEIVVIITNKKILAELIDIL